MRIAAHQVLRVALGEQLLRQGFGPAGRKNARKGKGKGKKGKGRGRGPTPPKMRGGFPGMPGGMPGMPAGFPDLSNMPAGLNELPPGLEGIDVSQFQQPKKRGN